MNENLPAIYNRFAATYESNRDLFDASTIFDEFYSGLNSQTGNILDLGCGAGEPFAVGAQRHRSDFVGVSEQSSQQLSGADVPDPEPMRKGAQNASSRVLVARGRQITPPTGGAS